MSYEGLDFGSDELALVVRHYYDELIAFVSTPSFAAVYKELMELVPEDRPEFVTQVLLKRDELERRGVIVPDGILIQVSAFGDRRPTLFAVKKFLPKKYHGAWENVNLTFFNEFKDDEISHDPVDAWRPPIPVAVQNACLSNGINLESIPQEYGVNYESFLLPARDRSEGA